MSHPENRGRCRFRRRSHQHLSPLDLELEHAERLIIFFGRSDSVIPGVTSIWIRVLSRNTALVVPVAVAPLAGTAAALTPCSRAPA